MNDGTTINSSTLATYVQSSGTTKATGATSGTFTSSEPSITSVSLFMVAFDSTSVSGASNYLMSNAFLSDAYESPDNPTNVGQVSADTFSGKSWTAIPAVPEPSTAALALAGLALLIRRRKA